MTATSPDAGPVEAAGGVAWRVREDVVEILVVHRPRYDDWSFPKGKLDPGENHETAARREVEEETGYRTVLGRELPSSEYVDSRGHPKVVRYWEMTVTGGGFRPNEEVDEIRWLDLDTAGRTLTYARDRALLECFRSLATAHRDP